MRHPITRQLPLQLQYQYQGALDTLRLLRNDMVIDCATFLSYERALAIKYHALAATDGDTDVTEHHSNPNLTQNHEGSMLC